MKELIQQVNNHEDRLGKLEVLEGINVNPLPKNWLINSNMGVCQRYGPAGSAVVAATTTRANSEVVDRWRHNRDGTGATVTASQQAFTIGQTSVPGEPTYFLRHNQSVAGSGGTQNYIQQWIEDVRTFAGQNVALSGYLEADATRTVNVRFRQFFGTGGSADVTTSNVISAGVTTAWQKFSGSLTLPSVSGKTITADSALVVEWQLPLNTAMTIDLAQWQLEAGAYATPFQKKNLAEELQGCYRYYQKSFLYATVPTSNTGIAGAWYAPVIVAGAVTEITKFPFLPSMRVAPNMTYYNPGGAGSGAYNTVTATSSGGNVTTATTTEKDNLITVVGAAGWAAGNPYYFHWTAEDPAL